MSSKKLITILGITGSVGQSTMDVILSCVDRFDVDCVSAQSNVKKLAESAIALQANVAIIGDEALQGALEELLVDTGVECRSGARAIEVCVDGADLVMAAIMGFAGLRPIVRALGQGIDVAVANKEPLVAAGAHIMDIARENGAQVLPVDSEHNAIFQVFESQNRGSIEKIILTASGGPFLNWTREDIIKATPEQAIKHPNWSMGAKISVDSASMMNKALEVIEAHYLFDMPADKIDVIIHPESIIHSMVSYTDGSTLAQMGASDMRTPIASALAWPERLEKGGDMLDLNGLADLSFREADFEQFPALGYAYKCLDMGQGACVALNAANEVAVAHFLSYKIAFGDILRCVGFAIDEYYKNLNAPVLKTIEDIEDFDNIVRLNVGDYIRALKG